MRRPHSDHTARDWRVHALARDFELLDVWRYPIRIRSDVPLRGFVGFLVHTQSEMVAGRGFAATLFRLRGWLGRTFGWDEDHSERAGVSTRARDSHSLRHRLEPAGSTDVLANAENTFGSDLGFDPLYMTDDESLSEIQNDTVHALMHLGRIPLESVEENGVGSVARTWR